MKKADVLTIFAAADIAKMFNISRAAVSLWGDIVPSTYWEALAHASKGALKMPTPSEYLRSLIRESLINEGFIRGSLEASSKSGVPGSSCLITENHFQMRDFRVVLNSLPPHLLAWVNYCYGQNTSIDDAIPCTQLVLEKFLAAHQTLSDTSIPIIKVLTPLAGQCVIAQINSGKPLFNGPAIRTLTRHTEATWKKHWAARWRELRGLWMALDTDSLEFIDKHYEEK